MTRAVQIAELGDQNVFTIDGDTSRVGIGSSTPTVKLDVGGNAQIGAAITMYSSSGIVSATSFYGSGANLTDVISGVELKFSGNSVGSAITSINFSGFSSVTAPTSGLSTVTASQTLTVGKRIGDAVSFNITGTSFNVPNRAGGNTAINV
jgi:hypothetical protein